VRNIKLTIEYDGTHYRGWQVQKTKKPSRLSNRTLQEAIEKGLQKILQEKIKLIGSGRTDAGVHALAQGANFKTKSSIRLDKLHRALNGILPVDISVAKVEEESIQFHSRFDARSKTYRYTIWNRKYRPALHRNSVYFYPYSLDLGRMKKESRILLGKHNFSSFQASDKKKRHSSTRTIKKLKIVKKKDFIHMDIEADGFLCHMARNIVGTLIEIGRGRFPQGSMRRILRARDRKQAGPTAPAKGLCLLEVKY
jgi:tRNA pseudouridine38-40 synthase